MSDEDQELRELPIGVLVGERVRYRRHQRGISVLRLAELTGIARPNIHRLERGSVAPSLATLDRVADALGTTIMDLVAPVDGCRRITPPNRDFEVTLEEEE